MQVRRLWLSSDKKHRVWDRCDLKLDNQEFENTYKSIIRAEEDIIAMQEQKRKEFERKISEAENNEVKQRQINAIQESRRKALKDELDDKIQGATTEWKFITKSKNLVTKNIQNADERINELNNGEFLLEFDTYHSINFGNEQTVYKMYFNNFHL